MGKVEAEDRSVGGRFPCEITTRNSFFKQCKCGFLSWNVHWKDVRASEEGRDMGVSLQGCAGEAARWFQAQIPLIIMIGIFYIH